MIIITDSNGLNGKEHIAGVSYLENTFKERPLTTPQAPNSIVEVGNDTIWYLQEKNNRHNLPPEPVEDCLVWNGTVEHLERLKAQFSHLNFFKAYQVIAPIKPSLEEMVAHTMKRMPALDGLDTPLTNTDELESKGNDALIADFMGMPYDYVECDACGKINPGLAYPETTSRITACCPREIGNYGKTWRPESGMLKNFKYQTSWDWLMPVVEKIEGLSVAGTDLDVYSDEKRECEWQFTVIIKNGGCTIDRDVLPQYGGTEEDFLNLYSCLKTDKIKSTYEAVIAFLKWYSTQNK